MLVARGMSSFRRMRLFMAISLQKYALPVSVVLLIGLIILLYRHDDPSKYPVGPAAAGHMRDTWHHGRKASALVDDHKRAHANPSRCERRSPEQVLALGSRRLSIFSNNKYTLPNYFLHLDNEVYSSLATGKLPSPRLVFMHHNKAGGTSVKTCLRAIGGAENLRVSQAITGFKRQRFHTQASHRQRLAAHDILLGGYVAGMCDEEFSKNRRCVVVTMLRHPLDRLISSYYYCKKKPNDQLCGSKAVNASQVSLAMWAQHQSGFLLAQLTYIPEDCEATQSASEPCWLQMKRALLKRSCSEADLVQLAGWVGDRLANVFTAIGVVDQMDLSLSMWQKATGFPFVKHCTGGHSFTLNQRQAEAVKDHGRKGKAGLREKAAADPVIQNALKIDILLFEKAQELFNRQVAVFLDEEKS